MYAVVRKPPEEGLGIAPFVLPLILSIVGAVGTAAATRIIAGPSSPSQKRVEEQLKLQQQLEIERMLQQQQIQQQNLEQIAQYALPALGLVALVAVLS